MILVTMVPLAFLEKKILACADPLSIISKFSGKVLLSHACFLVMRLPQHYVHDGGCFNLNFISCFVSLLAACVLFPVCFRVRSARAIFCENLDVWGVVLLGLLAAVLTEGANYYFDTSGPPLRFSELSMSAVGTGALDTELLAFVPAVEMVCRIDTSGTPTDDVDVADTKRRALALFAFLVAFYFVAA